MATEPIWNAIRSASPELFLFLGDNIYGDWHGDAPFTPSPESLIADYQALASKPEFAAVREKAHIMATWDNHDYGLHNGGKEFELKEMARKEFLDFFGEGTDSPRRKRDGIYDAKIFGSKGKRVQIILLDNRWNRDSLLPDIRTDAERTSLGLSGSMGHTPNTDSSSTILGENQWRWLEEQLLLPAEVRLICSGTQIINDTKGMQEWGNFPHERERLFKLIDSTKAKGVVMLSGNVHYSEVCKYDEGSYPLFDFTSSGMTHNSAEYAAFPNPYRVMGPYAENNYGLIEIDWDSDTSPTINMKIMGLKGKVGYELKVDLETLRST